MRKSLLPLILLPIALNSCKKNNSNDTANTSKNIPVTETKLPEKPKDPINSLDPEKPLDPITYPDEPKEDTKEKVSIIKIGNGSISLNNETSEHKITTEVGGDFDYKELVESGGLTDTTDYSKSKSSLFPNNIHSYIKIPEKIYFDSKKTVDGKGSDNKFDVNLQVWGTIGNKFIPKGYLLCYKSVKGEYSQFEFAVDQLKNNDISNCSEIEKGIKNGDYKKLDLNANDFILLRVNGFRFDSYGECLNTNTCKIFSNFNLTYYTEKN